jgi:hypothetical protein
MSYLLPYKNDGTRLRCGQRKPVLYTWMTFCVDSKTTEFPFYAVSTALLISLLLKRRVDTILLLVMSYVLEGSLVMK